MLFAIVTSLCWSFSAFGSSRISRHFGAAYSNGIRLACASLMLLGLSLATEGTVLLSGAEWFGMAGVCHLAIGDVALFSAYRRLGPRIALLLISTLAAPTALLMEWLTLGQLPSGIQIVCAVGIVGSVCAAIAPKERRHLERRDLTVGLLCGFLAAVGQGAGAAITRIAFVQTGEVESTSWLPVFYRVSAAAVGVWIWILFRYVSGHRPFQPPRELLPDKKVEGHPLIWLGVSTLLGPVIGMWFLMRAFDTTASSLVQATLATLPVFMIPVAWVFDGTVPSRRSLVAGCLAVGLTATLVLL